MVHHYKGFRIVRTGTKNTPWNIYKIYPTHNEWVGYGKTISECKKEIDDGCFY